jgi:hypothetical protein
LIQLWPGFDDLEGIAQVGFEGVIVPRGTCRVELLKLTDRAEEEGSRPGK